MATRGTGREGGGENTTIGGVPTKECQHLIQFVSQVPGVSSLAPARVLGRHARRYLVATEVDLGVNKRREARPPHIHATLGGRQNGR